MNSVIDKAWELYCDDTKGGIDVRDFWEELPVNVQTLYLNTAMEAAVLAEREACAKVCEEEHDKSKFGANGMNCAAAIRARGENK